ncbi:NAC domain-containing protein 78-like [Asparagus officinalis]|uniref:NAC domain-containing protein 78-like n=1 Tax=Asparagus officinalis TaxID=4686 RepID=UPI00098E0BC1|nr:NAC domain-containing protein 78-like [Asparagus officinalis]
MGGFVVCRIFQKSGSGPQNGAQYGAPFIEEEWAEEAEDFLFKTEEVSTCAGGGGQEYVQTNDFEEEKQDLGDQHKSAASVTLLQAQSEGQDCGSHADDPTVLLEEILNLDTYINEPGLQDGFNSSNDMGENSGGMVEQSHSPSGQNDGYLELKDIFADSNGPCNTNLTDVLRVHNDRSVDNGLNEANTWLEADGAEELNKVCQPAEAMYSLHPDDFLNSDMGGYPSGQLAEEEVVFYDAPSDEPPSNEEYFSNMDGIQFSPAADLSGFDMVDDLMAYFDATDNNLQYDVGSEFVAQSNAVSEVEADAYPTSKTTVQVPGTSIERGASSSFTGPTKELERVYEDKAAVTDMQVGNTWNNSLRKRVVDMLGSISAPPAMAEGSVKGKAALFASTNSSSSVQVSTGIIQIHGITVMGSSEEHWTLQKNGDTSFLLSYGMAANGRSLCFETSKRLRGGALGMLLRGGVYLFGLSVLVLSASLKVGLCVYTK